MLSQTTPGAQPSDAAVAPVAPVAPGVPGAPGASAGPEPGGEPAGTRERIVTGLWIAAAAAAALGLFYLLAPILAPFALAAVLAYLVVPGADRLQGLGLPRWLASLIMVLLCGAVALGLLVILVPVLEREALALNERLPTLLALLDNSVTPLVQRWLGVRLHFDPTALRALALQHVGQQDVVSALLERFGNGGLAVLGVLGTVMLVPVVLFYFLLDAAPFIARIEASLPRRWHQPTMGFLADIDAVLSQFLRGQLTVMLLLAVYYSVALALAGFDSALPIGVLTGLLIFIPYVGFALGFLLAVLAALLQFAGWTPALSVLGIYGVGYVVESFVLTPRLVGERIGLHPLAVIFALLAFGHVFGFFGVLVALPASAMLLVALRRVRGHYMASAFYNRP